MAVQLDSEDAAWALAERNRRCVYSVVKHQLPHGDAEAAMRIWEAEFAGSYYFSVLDYIKRLEKELELDPVNVTRLRLDLFREVLTGGRQVTATRPKPAAVPIAPMEKSAPVMADMEEEDDELAKTQIIQLPTEPAAVETPMFAEEDGPMSPQDDEVAALDLADVQEEGEFASHAAEKVFRILAGALHVRSLSAAGDDAVILGVAVKDTLADVPFSSETKKVINANSKRTRDWMVPLLQNVHQMSDYVNGIYVSMSEVLGPDVADKVLHGALRSAEKLPEALEFPPNRLV